MKKTAIAIALFTLSFVGFSRADGIIQFSLWPPVQIVSEDESVGGFRFSFPYGRNNEVSGLDLGIANETKSDFGGLGAGLVIVVHKDTYGLQWGMYSDTQGDLFGWQSSAFARVGGTVTGFQNGLIGWTEGDFGGGQLCFFSETLGTLNGIQMGVWNQAVSVEGIQIGLVNIADKMYGLQIGLWNQINDKESWNVLPLANWKF